MKKIVMSMLILFFMVSSLSAEVVFLTDGSILKGEIIKEGIATITIRSSETKIYEINRNTILRIFYGELRLDKIFVQKRDGNSFTAYKVDEDRDNYTFRTQLKVNEEFNLKKSDVLFMTEKNPSGLQVSGDIESDSVRLKWYPPYDEVKIYNIYVKRNDKDRFILIEKTKSLEITIKNLESKVKYIFAVTSIDKLNEESQFSNELKIITNSMRPGSPGSVKVEEQSSKNINDKVFKVSWKVPADPDGKVEKYRVYGIQNKKKVIIAETAALEYVLKNKNDYDRIEITAVDNDSVESFPVRIYSKLQMNVSVAPSVLIPMGVFSEMAETGYGMEFALNKNGVISEKIELGLSLGCYYLPGKDISDDKNLLLTRFFIVPLYFNAGYTLFSGKRFYVNPVLSLGFAYMNVAYRNASVMETPEKVLQTVDFSAKTGLSAGYIFSNSLQFVSGCEYGVFIEKSGLLSFLQINAGIKYSF
ncbi:MAG: fibronectin type III domain-containing protein [Spirochaetes bacterium]|nr:fibronectin type III domain-containing protein [Spirochaetota bacterium]